MSNPTASPAIASEADGFVGAPVQNAPTTAFRDPGTLTKITIAIIYVNLAFGVARFVSTGFERHLFDQIRAGTFATADQMKDAAASSDSRQAMVAVAALLAYVASIISVSLWTYRANSNARELGSKYMEFTPAWSVGWYFVPFANFVKPFQAMAEIWRTSITLEAWQTEPGSAVLIWWWLCWIGWGLLGGLTVRLKASAADFDGLMLANTMSLVDDAMGVATCLLLASVIRTIHQNQMYQHARMNTSRA